MTRRVIVPGGFDPVTVGHMDVAERALAMFDEVRVVAFVNSSKQGRFTPAQRLEMLRLACAELGERMGCPDRIVADSCDGFLADYVSRMGACAVVKGVRSVTDFDYELQLSRINRALGGVETVFLPARQEREFVSSTFVRELMLYDKPLDGYVPEVLLPVIAGYLKT